MLPRRTPHAIRLCSAQAATTPPCDTHTSGGAPCVAAHSTTRAPFASYDARHCTNDSRRAPLRLIESVRSSPLG
ncbi:arabinofuranosidase catalytic domain-containing protein [Actinacidiphila polyblastidii]|uniref:arabinofuranosidase catalytic domain-containing protein n=1 Tax=Actinacidiphila polyblastidii TaxID=3110430 RepID=UPI0039BC5FD2